MVLEATDVEIGWFGFGRGGQLSEDEAADGVVLSDGGHDEAFGGEAPGGEFLVSGHGFGLHVESEDGQGAETGGDDEIASLDGVFRDVF